MNERERDRYSRQILFKPLGEAGQLALRRSTAVIVGCGALGSFHAAALARAGAGRLILVDRDYVEWSNLQRQWLYDEADAETALPKAIAAARAIAKINSGVETTPVVSDLTPDNIEEHLAGADVILDGTDNFQTRYLLNDFSATYSIPWIYGGAVATYGIVMPVLPGRTACFECVYPEAPSGAQPTCETAGVLNTITSIVAGWQASLAFKILSGHAGEITPNITVFDVWHGMTRQMNMPARDPDCPACGARTCRHLSGRDRIPISLCGRNAVQIHDRRRPIDLDALAERLKPLGEVRSNGFALRFLLPPHEMTVFPDGRAIIKGTQDPGVARSLYSRYIGN